MSRQFTSPSALKRKRPETKPAGMVEVERAILDLIKTEKDLGICAIDIKQKLTLTDPIVNKSLKSLMTKKLIKEVVNIQNKRKKRYMAVEFEPSKEISGGEWYVDGNLDREVIDMLGGLCFRFLRVQKVASLETIHTKLKKCGVLKFEISSQQVSEILNLMVLNNEVIEVKSTGLGDYHSIPIETTCYRIASSAGVAKGPRMGAFASIPCGACPRISLCTPDGDISPNTCVHYTKWLNLDF